MMRPTLLLAILGAAACGGGKKADWTSRPIKTVSATTGGVAFTIDLPDGMRQKDDKDEVEWDILDDGRVHTPELDVSAGAYAKTIDEYVKTEPNVKTWLRKDKLADGYVVSHENDAYEGKDDWIVYAYRELGGKVLTCHARVTPWAPGETAKDKVPLVEKMCLSIKLE